MKRIAQALTLGSLINLYAMTTPVQSEGIADEASQIIGSMVEDAHRLGSKAVRGIGRATDPVLERTIQKSRRMGRLLKESFGVITDLPLERELAKTLSEGDEISPYYPKLGTEGYVQANILDRYRGTERMEVAYQHLIGPLCLNKTIEVTLQTEGAKGRWKAVRTIESDLTIDHTSYSVEGGKRIADGLVVIEDIIEREKRIYTETHTGKTLSITKTKDAFEFLPESSEAREARNWFCVDMDGTDITFGIEYHVTSSNPNLKDDRYYVVGKYNLADKHVTSLAQARMQGSVHYGNPRVFDPASAPFQLERKTK